MNTIDSGYGPEEGRFFECLVTITNHWYDNSGWKQSRIDELFLLQRMTLKHLYDEIAYIKIRDEKEENHYNESTTVEIGEIREITIHDIQQLDQEKINDTEAWKNHQRRLAETRAKKEAAEAEIQKRKMEAEEIRERTEYERLAKKFAS